MVKATVGYGMAMSRDPKHPGWVRVTLRKHLWEVRSGGRSRLVAETGFYSEGMNERDTVEAALIEILRALADDLA